MLYESDNQILNLPQDSSPPLLNVQQNFQVTEGSLGNYDFLDPLIVSDSNLLSQNSTYILPSSTSHEVSKLKLYDSTHDIDEEEKSITSSLSSLSMSKSESSTKDSFKEKDRSNHNRENNVSNLPQNSCLSIENKEALFTFGNLHNNKTNLENTSTFIPIPLYSFSLPPSPPPQPLSTSDSIPIPQDDNITKRKEKGRKKSKENNEIPSPRTNTSLSSSSVSSSEYNVIKRGKGRPRRTIDKNNKIPNIPVLNSTNSLSQILEPPLHSKKCGINLSNEVREWFEDVCSKKNDKKNLPIPDDVINKFKMIKDIKTECSYCKTIKRKLDCFLIDNTQYICYSCAAKYIPKSDAKRLQHWESEMKDGSGLCCQRLTHWYSVHDYVEFKNCDEAGRPLKGEAYKSSQQCIFCRNFKKYEYRISNSKK